MPFFNKKDEVLPVESSLSKIRQLTDDLGLKDRQLLESEARYKKLAEELREERNLLRQVLDANPSMIFVKDIKSRFILVNDKVAQVYGVRREDLIGKSDVHFNGVNEEVQRFHKNDVDVIENKREKLIPLEEVTSTYGVTRYYTTIKRPIINSDGTCDRLIGIATDITDAVMAQKALLLSETGMPYRVIGSLSDINDRVLCSMETKMLEESYRSVFNSSTDAIFIHDKSTGVILDVNETACSMIGYNKDQLISMGVGNFSAGPEFTQEKALDKILSTSLGKNNVFEWKMKDSQGQTFWVEVQLRLADFKGMNCVIANVRNIDHRKRTQLILESLYAKFEGVINNMLVGLVVIDENSVVENFNRTAERITGYSSKEVVGKNVTMLMPEEYRDPHTEALKEHVDGRGKAWILGREAREVPILRRNGAVTRVMLSVDEFYLDGKRLFVGTLTPVPEDNEK